MTAQLLAFIIQHSYPNKVTWFLLLLLLFFVVVVSSSSSSSSSSSIVIINIIITIIIIGIAVVTGIWYGIGIGTVSSISSINNISIIV